MFFDVPIVSPGVTDRNVAEFGRIHRRESRTMRPTLVRVANTCDNRVGNHRRDQLSPSRRDHRAAPRSALIRIAATPLADRRRVRPRCLHDARRERGAVDVPAGRRRSRSAWNVNTTGLFASFTRADTIVCKHAMCRHPVRLFPRARVAANTTETSRQTAPTPANL